MNEAGTHGTAAVPGAAQEYPINSDFVAASEKNASQNTRSRMTNQEPFAEFFDCVNSDLQQFFESIQHERDVRGIQASDGIC
jgi:hypothetical protein